MNTLSILLALILNSADSMHVSFAFLIIIFTTIGIIAISTLDAQLRKINYLEENDKGLRFVVVALSFWILDALLMFFPNMDFSNLESFFSIANSTFLILAVYHFKSRPKILNDISEIFYNLIITFGVIFIIVTGVLFHTATSVILDLQVFLFYDVTLGIVTVILLCYTIPRTFTGNNLKVLGRVAWTVLVLTLVSQLLKFLPESSFLANSYWQLTTEVIFKIALMGIFGLVALSIYYSKWLNSQDEKNRREMEEILNELQDELEQLRGDSVIVQMELKDLSEIVSTQKVQMEDYKREINERTSKIKFIQKELKNERSEKESFVRLNESNVKQIDDLHLQLKSLVGEKEHYKKQADSIHNVLPLGKTSITLDVSGGKHLFQIYDEKNSITSTVELNHAPFRDFVVFYNRLVERKPYVSETTISAVAISKIIDPVLEKLNEVYEKNWKPITLRNHWFKTNANNGRKLLIPASNIRVLDESKIDA